MSERDWERGVAEEVEYVCLCVLQAFVSLARFAHWIFIFEKMASTGIEFSLP